MARRTKRPQIRSIAICGIVIGVRNGQRVFLGMIQVYVLTVAEVRIGEIHKVLLRLSAWLATILASPICLVFDRKGDRFPVLWVKLPNHWHYSTPF